MSKLEHFREHFSTIVEQTVFGIDFQLAQDPESHNHGTTVWDASIVLAKYLEKNAQKGGDMSRAKATGKRCIELGAGLGLAGMAFSLLGADTLLTDTTTPVLTLLQRNVDSNLAPAALNVKGAGWAVDTGGSVAVCELDWANSEQYKAVQPPYDYIIAADCVYSETVVPHFLNAVRAMAGPRTSIAICNEFRSESVQAVFMTEFSKHFTMRKVAMNKMDAEYWHPLIHIYLMKMKKKEKEKGKKKSSEEGVEVKEAVMMKEDGR